MSMLDDLLDEYGELAEAALRLERSRGNHPGVHEFCCENGRCLKCDEARVRAEEDLHEALAKVAPRPVRPGARNKLVSGVGLTRAAGGQKPSQRSCGVFAALLLRIREIEAPVKLRRLARHRFSRRAAAHPNEHWGFSRTGLRPGPGSGPR
jgi:hypothetical protein